MPPKKAPPPKRTASAATKPIFTVWARIATDPDSDSSSPPSSPPKSKGPVPPPSPMSSPMLSPHPPPMSPDNSSSTAAVGGSVLGQSFSFSEEEGASPVVVVAEAKSVVSVHMDGGRPNGLQAVGAAAAAATSVVPFIVPTFSEMPQVKRMLELHQFERDYYKMQEHAANLESQRDAAREEARTWKRELASQTQYYEQRNSDQRRALESARSRLLDSMAREQELKELVTQTECVKDNAFEHLFHLRQFYLEKLAKGMAEKETLARKLREEAVARGMGLQESETTDIGQLLQILLDSRGSSSADVADASTSFEDSYVDESNFSAYGWDISNGSGGGQEANHWEEPRENVVGEQYWFLRTENLPDVLVGNDDNINYTGRPLWMADLLTPRYGEEDEENDENDESMRIRSMFLREEEEVGHLDLDGLFLVDSCGGCRNSLVQDLHKPRPLAIEFNQEAAEQAMLPTVSVDQDQMDSAILKAILSKILADEPPFSAEFDVMNVWWPEVVRGLRRPQPSLLAIGHELSSPSPLPPSSLAMLLARPEAVANLVAAFKLWGFHRS